jgi:hypothetical protein
VNQQPAIITLTGDNGLTVGLMLAVLYLGALFAAQLWRRASAGKMNGTVNQ